MHASSTIHAMQFQATQYKIQNDLTVQHLTTCLAKQGQKFYTSIFYNSGTHTNMTNTQQHRHKCSKRKNIWKVIQDKNVKWIIQQRSYLKYVHGNTNRMQKYWTGEILLKKIYKSLDKRYTKCSDRCRSRYWTGKYTAAQKGSLKKEYMRH